MKIKNNIPNAFTLLNLSAGVLAIIHMFYEDYYMAALLIILAGFLDRFDGMIARKLNATSNIGKELDSLSDLISFGIAPSILIWNLVLANLGVIGTIVTLTFAVAGAYRLARYNVTDFSGVYMGIPITLAGGIVSIISLYAIKYGINQYLASLIMILLAYSMVSTKLKLKKR